MSVPQIAAVSAIFLVFTFSGHITHAQTSDPCPNPGTFGCFEVGLPGKPELAAGQTIDTFVNSGTPILTFINTAVNVVVAILVIIGVISIVVGGYIYMTAAGNANQVGTAKEIIKAALFGIVIALTSVIILNTINTFLGSGAKEPELGSGTGGGLEPEKDATPQNPFPENALPSSSTPDNNAETTTQASIDQNASQSGNPQGEGSTQQNSNQEQGNNQTSTQSTGNSTVTQENLPQLLSEASSNGTSIANSLSAYQNLAAAEEARLTEGGGDGAVRAALENIAGINPNATSYEQQLNLDTLSNLESQIRQFDEQIISLERALPAQEAAGQLTSQQRGQIFTLIKQRDNAYTELNRLRSTVNRIDLYKSQ